MKKKKNTNHDLSNDSQEIIERLVPDSENEAEAGKKKRILYKKRTHEPSEDTLTLEIAKQKTLEEIWDEKEDGAALEIKGKETFILRIFILFIVIVAGWGLLNSYCSRPNTETSLAKLENESKEKRIYKTGEEIMVATEIIDQYLNAATLEEKSKHIYQAEILKNDIQAYYERNDITALTDYTIIGVLPIIINEEQILEVVIKSISPFSEERSYYLRQDSAGDYKIDWKADVILQDNSIKDFKESRSRKATSFKFVLKRINAINTYEWAFKKLDYNVQILNTPYRDKIFWGLESRHELPTYNWGFKDTDFNVFRLDVPNSNFVFWGYVKKGSQVEEKLFRLIEENVKMRVLEDNVKHEFILKVRFLEDSPQENDQYIFIEEVISNRWVNTNE